MDRADSSPSWDGYRVVRAALCARQVDDLLRRADARYAKIDAIRVSKGPWAVAATLGQSARFLATASSLSLSAVLDDHEQTALLHRFTNGPAFASVVDALGSSIAVDNDQTWVRRQYAPDRYPALHAPHGWHQDGALGFDFPACHSARLRGDGLLEMVTCWIALTFCGGDAPGLELISCGELDLLPVEALSDHALRRCYAANAFQRPLLAPGDALVFAGGTIHRTHVTSSMRENRTSVELRFFRADAIPARLRRDRFVAVRPQL